MDFSLMFLTIDINLSKKAICPKKVGVTDLLKLENPVKVVVLVKSAIFDYKSSSAKKCLMNDVAPLQLEFVHPVLRMRKNN